MVALKWKDFAGKQEQEHQNKIQNNSLKSKTRPKQQRTANNQQPKTNNQQPTTNNQRSSNIWPVSNLNKDNPNEQCITLPEANSFSETEETIFLRLPY